MPEVDHRFGMSFRESAEQADLKTFLSRHRVFNLSVRRFQPTSAESLRALNRAAHKRWELLVISNKNETFSIAKWSKTSRESNLRCLVDNAIVKASASKNGVIYTQCCSSYDLRSEQALFKLSDACRYFL